jgi:polyisoprenoid-binding protein YceI
LSHGLPEISPGVYTIDTNESLVQIDTVHWFGLGKVQATFDLIAGELKVTDPLDNSSIRATVSAGSFNSQNPKRDKQVRSRSFLHADSHPEFVFTSTSLALASGSSTVYGKLAVKGIEEQVILNVTNIEAHEGTITARATANIDRRQHGIRAMPGIAGRFLGVTIHVTARRDGTA